jgi:hypothetical protein
VIHSLVGTLSVKPESAARHGFYQDDARKSGFDDCAELFGQPAESEAKSIQGSCAASGSTEATREWANDGSSGTAKARTATAGARAGAGAAAARPDTES